MKYSSLSHNGNYGFLAKNLFCFSPLCKSMLGSFVLAFLEVFSLYYQLLNRAWTYTQATQSYPSTVPSFSILTPNTYQRWTTFSFRFSSSNHLPFKRTSHLSSAWSSATLFHFSFFHPDVRLFIRPNPVSSCTFRWRIPGPFCVGWSFSWSFRGWVGSCRFFSLRVFGSLFCPALLSLSVFFSLYSL